VNLKDIGNSSHCVFLGDFNLDQFEEFPGHYSDKCGVLSTRIEDKQRGGASYNAFSRNINNTFTLFCFIFKF